MSLNYTALFGAAFVLLSNSAHAVINEKTGTVNPTSVPDEPRYIIKYKTPTPLTQVPSVAAQAQFSLSAAQSILSRAGVSPLMHLQTAAASVARLDARQLAQLKKDPAIEYVEVDPKRYLMAEETPYGITMVQAPLLPDSSIANRKVCIVDTGYSLGHQDLPSSGITGNDGYGSNDTGNWYEDGNGHGTHVAGTIAALGGNNLGVVGVSPSGNIGLHIVKVFNNSGNWAYGSDLVVAMQQCRDAGANVISMSLGGGGSSVTERNAMDSAFNNNVLVVAAAGNDGNSALSYPASYASVISVAAVDSNRNRASFSQYNAEVEIAAPGVGVRSTTPGNTYGNKSGTSMATPHASAVYALVWSRHTQCTAAQIRQVVNATAQDRGSAGRDVYYGYGITQAKAASDAIAANGCETGGTPPTPPEGETHANLRATTGNWVYHSFSVPAGTSSLKVRITGGTGDADLYTRLGSRPTTSSWTCRPYRNGNEEVCTLANPAAGTWHTGIRAYSSFSGVTLSWEYQ